MSDLIHHIPVVTERSEDSVRNVYFRVSDRFYEQGVHVYTELVYSDYSKSGWMYHESTLDGFIAALAIGKRIQAELYYKLVKEPHFLLRR